MASSSKTSAAKAILLGKREPEDDLETKPILKKHNEKSEEKETTEGFADSLQRVELLETKSDHQANLISVKETMEGLDETPNFVEESASRKKTLFVGHLSPQTEISHIIDFFKDVSEVFRVQLTVNQWGEHLGCGFVEFASSNEAKKALEKKNGGYLCGNKITLGMAEIASDPPRPKYCIDHKVVCHKDYLRQESLPIEEDDTVMEDDDTVTEDDDTEEELDETPDPVEEFVVRKKIQEVAIRKKTLFVANLSPQTKVIHFFDFFNDVGEVVSVRLIVNHEGKHVGYGFVEFASAYEAKKALEEKNGEYLHDHKIFIDVANTAPYPPRQNYNLAEMLCYEDYLLRETLLIEDETVEGLVEEVAVRKKTLFIAPLNSKTKILDIINFFKDVGEVVHVRLLVGQKGKHFGYGFVQFASANEAEKALEKKNGEYLHNRRIVLEGAKIVPYHVPKYCIDHKVWYEDYLRRESLLIEEDETVEGLVEEVAIRKKTLFVANLSPQTKILHIIDFFKDVGEVFRVRLIVNHMGEHVGCGFVEFASAYKVKKAMEKKIHQNLGGRSIFLGVAEIAPYPLRPKYNLAEKLWYEDYLRRESLLKEEDDLETKPNREKQKEDPEEKVTGVFCGKKITFSDDD